jgi:hypothetical protein
MRILKLLLVFISASSFAQVRLADGYLDLLKDEKSIRIKFVYKNVFVEGLHEKEYISQEMQEHELKSPGGGERWKDRWYADRTFRYEPRFKKMFVKNSSLTVDDNAKYTLIFETLNIELGYNVGDASSSSSIDAYVSVVETSDPAIIIAQFDLTNMKGLESVGSGYDVGSRLQEAYGRAGVELGRLIKKEMRK